MRDEIIDLTTRLCMFRSEETEFAESKATTDFIEAFIRKHCPKACIKYIEGTNQVLGHKIRSLYAYLPSAVGKKILLLGHGDVVPAEPRQYIPEIKDDNLYARGSADMKGGVAVAMLIFKKHADKGAQLLITMDEEIGGDAGAKIAAKTIVPDFIITTEPTEFKIRTREKGGLWMQIDAHSLGGHASAPWVSRSAIEILFEVFREIRRLIPIPYEDHWNNTVTIGGMYGGNLNTENGKIGFDGANSIAKYATMRLDFRITEKIKHQDIIDLVGKAVDDVSERLGLSGEEKVVVHEPGVVVDIFFTDESNEYVKALDEAYSIALGKKPEHAYGHGASDTRFFSVNDIPGVVFGPIGVDFHSTKEHVRISSLVDLYSVLDIFFSEEKY